MKILILTSSFPYSERDHHANFIFHHAKGQANQGHEVHVLCPHIPGTPFFEIMQGVHVHRFPYFYPYHYQRLASDTGMYSALRKSPLAIVQLPLFFISEFCYAWQILRRNNIDLIHSHWFIPSGLVGAAIKSIWKKPHVITSHVLDANLFGKFRFSLPILSIIVASADIITTNSSYTKKQIEELVTLQCPCRVIPMGIYLPDHAHGLNEVRGHTILYVGRLIEWKGVDTLIRSMALVVKAIPDSRLIIVGEGPNRGSFERLVQEIGLSDFIRFYGRASDDDLKKLYDSAAVFVLPSRRYHGLVMEGLGVVLLEAMSHGVPVIGSNVGGIPDIIIDGETGFLVPEQELDILAERIVKILTNTELQEKLRRNGLIHVQDSFSWEIVSKKFSEVYREVLEY